MSQPLSGIVCVGCNRDSARIGEYDEDNPVTEDGTYANGKFVCTDCYVKLIPKGLDIGSPELIQQRMIQEVKQS